VAAVVLNSPEPMTKVRVITLKDYSEPTLKALHKVGVLHAEVAEELKPLDKIAIESQQREVGELLTFIHNMLGYIGKKEEVSPEEDVEVIYTRPFGEVGKEIRSVYASFAELYEETVKIDKEIKELTEKGKYLGLLTQQFDVRLRDLAFSGEYLFSRVFILSSEAYKAAHDELKNYLFEGTVATVEGETVLYAIGKMQNLETVESVITGSGGRTLLIPDGDLTLGKFLKTTEDRLLRLEEKRSKLYEELQTKAQQEVKNIALFRGVLIAERQRLSVLAKACEAKYVALVEGWIPESYIESAITELKENIDYVFIDTRKPEPSEEPPTKLRNPAALKPFQVVVNLFGIPRYREWDPTPIVAYSFATFFGLMIADVGYAIGLMLFARFLLGRLLGGAGSEPFKLLQRLVYISSGVALALGLLTGSYLGNIYTFFGFENMALVAGVQQMLQSPLTFVILAIFIGWVHLSIAHISALVKGIKERNTGVVLNRAGILLLQFGAFWILRVLMQIDIPVVLSAIMNVPYVSPQVYDMAMYGAIGGAALIAIGSVKERGGIGAMLWLFDITGLLGDVMSYSRLAGVGLATFYLGAAFNMLAQVLSGMIPGVGIAAVVGGAIVAVIIIIIGHMVNMLLSFLTGFVHSLRLCFVEFLIKFFEAGGVRYSPFRLIRRPSMVVGARP